MQREQVPKSPFVFTSERGDAQGTSLELARARPEDLLASAVSTVGRRAKAPSRCGCSAPIPRKSNRRCTVPSSSYDLARRSNLSSSRWINSDLSANVIKLKRRAGARSTEKLGSWRAPCSRGVCQQDNVVKHESAVDRLLVGMAARHPPMDRRHIDLRSVCLGYCRLF